MNENSQPERLATQSTPDGFDMSDQQSEDTSNGRQSASTPMFQLTISELINPRIRGELEKIRELEEYRVRWERVHGPVDLTKRYVTLLSVEEQTALFALDPKRYWDALPPLIQDFYLGKIKIAAQDGRLDMLPDEYIQMYMSGQLTRSKDQGLSR